MSKHFDIDNTFKNQNQWKMSRSNLVAFFSFYSESTGTFTFWSILCLWLVSCIKLTQPFIYDTVSCAIVALYHLHNYVRMPICNKPEMRHHDQSRRFSNGGSKPETAASRKITGSSCMFL